MTVNPNCGVPLLSSYIRLARRLFPDSFPPCSLCLLPASTTFVQSYLYDKLLHRETTADPRKSKSNIVEVMVKNGAKMLHHSPLKQSVLWSFAELRVSVKILGYATEFQHSLASTWTWKTYTETREKTPTTFYLKLLFSPKEIETPVSVNRKHMANSSMPTSPGDYIWCGWCHVDEKTINCEKCHFSKISWLAFSRR